MRKRVFHPPFFRERTFAASPCPVRKTATSEQSATETDRPIPDTGLPRWIWHTHIQIKVVPWKHAFALEVRAEAFFIFCFIFRKSVHSLQLYSNRIHFHRFQIQVQPVMLNHPVAEHLPQDIAAELCQRGIDEQVLPVQCFRQRAARTGVFFLYPMMYRHETCDYFQGTDSFIQFWMPAVFIFFGTVPITTCPVVCVFPKSIQYKGVS